LHSTAKEYDIALMFRIVTCDVLADVAVMFPALSAKRMERNIIVEGLGNEGTQDYLIIMPMQ
jgi:hypothetical protein